MANKTTIQSGNTAAITKEMQANLEKAGITDNKTLDRLIGKYTLDKILSDLPAVTQYFRLANIGYKALTEWPEDFKAVSAMPDEVSVYKPYFGGTADTSKGVPGLDFIPGKLLSDPKAFGQWAGLNPQETQAFAYFQTGGKMMAMSNKNYGGGSPPPAPSGPSGGYGGSGGTGGGGYGGGGGGSKSLGMGPPSKDLDMPGPPPGMGGGGSTGSYDGGGIDNSGGYTDNYDYYNQNYTSNEQSYVQNNLQGIAGADWFGPLLMGENQYRGIAAEGVAMLDQIKARKNAILAEMQGLGDDPDSMRKMYALQQEMQMAGTDEQQVMDKIMRGQHAHDEFMGLAKGLIDKENDTIARVIQNIGK